jgi:hypothetical protein
LRLKSIKTQEVRRRTEIWNLESGLKNKTEQNSKNKIKEEGKMKKALSATLAAVFVLSFFVFVSADVVTKFYGYEWLRYDYNVVGGSYAGSTGSNNNFTIPRTYLRWKMTDESAGYEGNLTLDINNVNAGQATNIDWASWLKAASVDFTKVPFLSDIDALIRAGQQSVYYGTIDTWAYPVIEKAMEDKNGIVSSADQGIALVGKIPAGFGGYELAVYNGTGYKDVPNDGTSKGPNLTDKAYDASLLITPIAGLYARASYFHKVTSILNAHPTLGYDSTALVVGGATGPVEGFVEYVTLVDASKYSATASGVAVGVSGYIGIKLTDMVTLCGRVDTYNPDTTTKNDEKNMYTGGVNLKLNDKVTLQLDYQLDEYRYPGHGANDNNNKNNNQWMSQIVWAW